MLVVVQMVTVNSLLSQAHMQTENMLKPQRSFIITVSEVKNFVDSMMENSYKIEVIRTVFFIQTNGKIDAVRYSDKSKQFIHHLVHITMCNRKIIFSTRDTHTQ